MASTAQTEPHFQLTCADPITNGVLCYNVFLCHVDLQTASRDERWPIKTLLYHCAAHKYCRPANLWESKTVFCDPKNCIFPPKTVFYNKMHILR